MPKVLADLRLYKGQLDDAIAALDKLALERGERPGGKKRGRPPKASIPTAEPAVAVKRRKRKPVKSSSSA